MMQHRQRASSYEIWAAGSQRMLGMARVVEPLETIATPEIRSHR
jgi:hypothetical protein